MKVNNICIALCCLPMNIPVMFHCDLTASFSAAEQPSSGQEKNKTRKENIYCDTN